MVTKPLTCLLLHPSACRNPSSGPQWQNRPHPIAPPPHSSRPRAKTLPRVRRCLLHLRAFQWPCRKLATQNPDAFDPYLAAALISLANHCSGVGLKEKALGVIQHSVELYEALVASKADAFEPELGGCLTVLSNCYAGLRRWEEALRAGERALEIYERLTKRN